MSKTMNTGMGIKLANSGIRDKYRASFSYSCDFFLS